MESLGNDSLSLGGLNGVDGGPSLEDDEEEDDEASMEILEQCGRNGRILKDPESSWFLTSSWSNCKII